MTTKTFNRAQDVINAFPTFKEILTNPAYEAQVFQDPTTRMMILRATKEGEIACSEIVAQMVNHMVTSMTGAPFFNTYGSRNTVFDAYEGRHEVTTEEFQALIKVFWFSYMGVQMTDRQFDTYLDFKSIPKIFRIMD